MRPGRRRGRPLAGGGGSLGGMSRPFALKEEEEEEELGFVLPPSLARDWNRRRRKGQKVWHPPVCSFPPCLEMLDKMWNSVWLLNSPRRKCHFQMVQGGKKN